VARVCFITCTTWPEISASDALVRDALVRRGVAVEARAWNGPVQDFDAFDLVLLRSNWDYHHAIEAFAGWLDGVDRADVRVWNPPALVRWNLSKRYLLELAEAGVPTVPSVVLDGEAAARLREVLVERRWTNAVVKPLVSASAHDTALVLDGDADRVVEALALGAIRRPVLVQPFVEEIRTRGEWSVVFVDGAVTHTVLKRPGPGEFRVQAHLGGSSEARPAGSAVLNAARLTLAALPLAPLYARIDGVETADGFRVMEVEVNEPGLFFTLAPAAAEALADAVCRRLRPESSTDASSCGRRILSWFSRTPSRNRTSSCSPGGTTSIDTRCRAPRTWPS
jgi:glutathione synthase/RimK-type ligase-like ATP-grasp enzyme